MKWEKRGIIHQPNKQYSWNQKYDILPTPIYLEEKGIIRVFIGTTDKDNYGRITFLDLDAGNPLNILYEHNDYILGLGDDGTFDDCGVVPSCIIKSQEKDEFYLYTVGFQRTVKTPYMLFAGLAVSTDLTEFKRFSNAPILSRNEFRYISQGAPCVIYEDGIYKMWHWYATKWLKVKGKSFMDYHIGYAESNDGKIWDMKNISCLKPRIDKGEFAVARPWVFKKNEKYHMLYSSRYEDRLYRIEYAVSSDGIVWDREFCSPFDVSDEGWDSEMICYPSVVDVNGKVYMFYNGNNNGETGFGYAELLD
ncbi:hypothetical protein [Marinomonas transparens]|uniref:Glycosylase n=1 Tax=Marinomonas transparens TaxID=2795388 RepID=A0A934JNP2_9GAMM|nr:hypothetical protein [Marinomonas transparens]MBJ7537808.1 hypothetical protein [Marinomonas transparens]